MFQWVLPAKQSNNGDNMKKYMLIQKHLFTNKFLDEQATHIMVYHLLKMSIIANLYIL